MHIYHLKKHQFKTWMAWKSVYGRMQVSRSYCRLFNLKKIFRKSTLRSFSVHREIFYGHIRVPDVYNLRFIKLQDLGTNSFEKMTCWGENWRGTQNFRKFEIITISGMCDAILTQTFSHIFSIKYQFWGSENYPIIFRESDTKIMADKYYERKLLAIEILFAIFLFSSHLGGWEWDILASIILSNKAGSHT